MLKKWFPLIILRTVYYIAFVYNVLIAGEGLTPIVLYVKGQGHKGHFCKKWFPLILLRNILYRAFICNVLIALSEDKTPIDFGFTRS